MLVMCLYTVRILGLVYIFPHIVLVATNIFVLSGSVVYIFPLL